MSLKLGKFKVQIYLHKFVVSKQYKNTCCYTNVIKIQPRGLSMFSPRCELTHDESLELEYLINTQFDDDATTYTYGLPTLQSRLNS